MPNDILDGTPTGVNGESTDAHIDPKVNAANERFRAFMRASTSFRGAKTVEHPTPEPDDSPDVEIRLDLGEAASSTAAEAQPKKPAKPSPGELAHTLIHAAHVRHRVIVRYRQEWLGWADGDGAYRPISEEDMTADIVKHVMRSGYTSVSPGLVAAVKLCLAGTNKVRDDVDTPCWPFAEHMQSVGPGGYMVPYTPPDPSRLLAFRNGILDLPAYATGDPGAFRPSDYRFFTRNALDFDWSPTPTPTPRWDRFLAEVFDDQDSRDLLAEWLGHILLPDTRHHKILLGVGKTRAGKGTVSRVASKLVGERNFIAPTAGDLASDFGRSTLIGKTVAVIPDLRIGKNTDTSSLLETLLSISGNDRPAANRKHKEFVRLNPVHLGVMSNVIPSFFDDSPAVANRFLILRFSKSFLGNEDLDLDDTLERELPGILHHAIRGWSRLQANGRFTTPAAGEEVRRIVEDSGSAFGHFIHERCVIGADQSIEKSTLYDLWKVYCEARKMSPGAENRMGQKLFAVDPAIVEGPRPRGAHRGRTWVGIGRRDTPTRLPG